LKSYKYALLQMVWWLLKSSLVGFGDWKIFVVIYWEFNCLFCECERVLGILLVL